MTGKDLDLGCGVTANFTSWGPFDKAGLIEYHPCMGGNCRAEDGGPGRCGGSILFDLPGIAQAFPNRDLWYVEALDPLTLTPSVSCGCQGCAHHGWIRAGKWVSV